MTENTPSQEFLEYHEQIMRIPQEVHKWIVGADNFIKLLIICLLSGSKRRYNSHVFAEEQVGVGKTTMMEAFARACGGNYSWIQFTPDLMPLDLIRVIKELPDGSREYQKGPIHGNFIVADEINRASEKTRAALLQGMEHGRITVDNDTHELPRPFMVLATANPMDVEGVFRLGVAQNDRFMMKVRMEEETEEEALAIIDSHLRQEREEIRPAVTPEQILGAREFIWKNIYLSADLKQYLVRWVRHTRQLYNEEEKAHGASGKRAYIWLARGSKAVAFWEQRDFVAQNDIDFLVPLILEHRSSLGLLSTRAELAEKMREMAEEMRHAEARR